MAIATEHPTKARRRLAWLRPIKLPPPVNPALVKEAEVRADEFGNGLSDMITRFAGSMTFVYLHVIWFAGWIGLGIESYPYGLLTMIVSLEAIFLSTFVMISQNRAAAKQQALADQEWRTVQDEDKQNVELLALSNQILALTKEVHAFAADERSRGTHGVSSKQRRAREPDWPGHKCLGSVGSSRSSPSSATAVAVIVLTGGGRT